MTILDMMSRAFCGLSFAQLERLFCRTRPPGRRTTSATRRLKMISFFGQNGCF